MENLKKISLSILIGFFLTVNIAKAETIKFHVPTSPAGNYAQLAKLASEALAEKGWQFDLKNTHNLQLSSNTFKETKEPFILLWLIEAAGSKQDSVYLKPADETNLIGMFHTSSPFLCAIKTNLTMDDFLNKKYKVGYTADRGTEKWINDFTSHIGNKKHIFVPYKGSGDLDIGVNSGEIDFIIASRGPKLMQENKAQCFYQTGNAEFVGIPTIKSKFPKLENSTYIIGAYLIAKNIPQEQLEKLRKDFEEVKKNHKPLIEFTNRLHFALVFDDIPTQVKTLKIEDSKISN
jgi:hypothetical protein